MKEGSLWHWRRTLASLTHVSNPWGFAGEDDGSGTLCRIAGPGSGGLSRLQGPLRRTEHGRTAAAKITQTQHFCGKRPISRCAIKHPTYPGQPPTLCRVAEPGAASCKDTPRRWALRDQPGSLLAAAAVPAVGHGGGPQGSLLPPLCPQSIEGRWLAQA